MKEIGKEVNTETKVSKNKQYQTWEDGSESLQPNFLKCTALNLEITLFRF